MKNSLGAVAHVWPKARVGFWLARWQRDRQKENDLCDLK
jgi:hypothetical protein